ncbi:MFS transporter [Cellulosimicrobium cellulans]|uniref:MFS transporter n=1 Tax=Cellulosimicrobium cellulans TaxID=1710 RepID=UPI001EDACECD|nr:MFS transporter [Cellulosimicrobium cellulans]UKJ65083.1 MFS transporter [Cellulosimicrobium cellulans]
MSHAETTEVTAVRAGPREWAGLTLLVLPMLMVATDLTVLFFALPSITADLDASATQALWISHAYGFLIAGTLVTAGRLADRVGARRLLLVGATAFAVLSVLAATATSAETLIVVRALLGVTGSTLMPALFSLLRMMFRADAQRRLAIAILFSSFSVGAAIGPVLGGALLERFWWGSVFLVNAPPMLLLVLLGPRLLPRGRGTGEGRLDLTSVALSVAGSLGVVYGLQELAAGPSRGATAVRDAAVLVAGALVLALFVRRQRQLPDPLLDLRLVTAPRPAAALGTLLLTGIGVVGVYYLFTQHLQLVAGLGPLEAGLWTLPYVAVNIVGALLAPGLASRFRPETVVAVSLVVIVAGAVLTGVVGWAGVPVPALAASVAVLGLGHGAAAALMSDLVISSAPPAQTGSAAATQEVSAELGTALGIAVSGVVAVVVQRSALSDGAASASDGASAPALPAYAVVGALLVSLAATLVVRVLVRRPVAADDRG